MKRVQECFSACLLAYRKAFLNAKNRPVGFPQVSFPPKERGRIGIDRTERGSFILNELWAACFLSANTR